MIALAQAIMLSEGWRRRLIAFAAGATGVLALAPFNLFVAIAVPLTCAVWLIDGSARSSPGTRRRWGWSGLASAADAGFWWGFGYFIAGLWWLGAAFLVEADQFAWALPLGVLGLPAALALFTALGFAVARLIWAPGGWRILSLAAGLGLSEWLRGNVLTGFPWNALGMALGGNVYLAQPASLIGLYGLTLLTIVVFAAPATMVDGARRWTGAMLAASALLIADVGFGIWRLSAPPVALVPGVHLRLVQPNVLKDEKFKAENKDALLADYLKLSDMATSPQNSGVADVTHLIWPESAFPFLIASDQQALSRIGAMLPPTAVLIAGAARAGAKLPGERRPPIYNALQVIASGGAIEQVYDKVHLAPFGEYMPFPALLDLFGLHQFTLSSFTPGPRRKLLDIRGLPAVAPLICYEAIFSGEVTPEPAATGGSRPGLLLNVTDDSWFGYTPGPFQHLAQARLRAIEEGLPMIRDADSGISAVIDPYGRILDSLPLGTKSVLDSGLPVAAAVTPFSADSRSIPITLWLIILFSAFMRRMWV